MSYLRRKSKKSSSISKNNSWKRLMKLAGIIKKGPKDLSQNPGKYIKKMYEEKYNNC